MDMTYQQAHAIKKRSFGELMAMNIASGGSITGSLGKTIAQKTKARATRFKEKFDPLNIAKFMTGGSHLGPAMLGRLLGRSQRDIEYFSGVRARPISGGKYTKIGKVQEQSDLMPVLEKIYGFLKKTNEDDIKRKEMEKNFQEENKLEDERRHQELMKAITGKETATPVKKKGGESSNMFGDFMRAVKDMIDTAINAFQSVVEKMIEGALKSFEWIKKAAPWLGRMLMSPAFLAFAGFALAGYALWELTNWIAKNTPDYKTIKDPEQAKNILENGSPRDIEAAGGREYLTGLITKQKEDAQYILDNTPELSAEERQKYEKILGITVTPQTETARPVPPRPDPSKGTLGRKKAEKWDAEHGATHNWDGTPKKATTAKPLPQGVEESKAGAGRGMAVLEDYNARTTPTGAVFGVKPKGIKSVPVTAPKSNVNGVIQDNQNLKLEDKIGKAVESSVNNTNVSSLTTSPPQKRRLPSVRNMEETFQRMIYNSTRVV